MLWSPVFFGQFVLTFFTAKKKAASDLPSLLPKYTTPIAMFMSFVPYMVESLKGTFKNENIVYKQLKGEEAG